MERKYLGMSFEQVLRKYADVVTRICLIHCDNESDAQDCFQNVFIKLYKCNVIFESEEHIKAWLLRVSMNECIDLHRQFWKKRITLSDELIIGQQSNMEEESDVITMLRQLPMKYRRVLYCYYYEEMSISEIATQFSISDNTVKTQMVRGRKLLGKMIEEEQELHYFA